MRPLVDPGPPLSLSEAARFSRHTLLPQFGDLGQRRLRRASVCVVGAGGLGSPALLYLVAAGVGRLGLVDRDEVDSTNLQRQILHGASDVGRRKVESAREALLRIDPEVVVEVHDVDLTPAGAREIFVGYDVVLDGSDNFPTRYLVNDACAELGLPLVWGSVLGFDAQVSVFWSAPPEGAAVDLRDLFPDPPAPQDVPSCAVAGVLGALCGQVGSLMATEAVKLITGTGAPLLGRVLVLDALAARWREVPLRRSPGRADAEPAPASGPASAPLAGSASRSDEISAATLAEWLATGHPVTVVDVRDPVEHAAGSIAGSALLPLSDLRAGRLGRVADVPEDRMLVVYCGSGVRSAEGARLLRAAGRRDVTHLAGGYGAWLVERGRDGSPRGGTRRAVPPSAESARDAAGRRARLGP